MVSQWWSDFIRASPMNLPFTCIDLIRRSGTTVRGTHRFQFTFHTLDRLCNFSRTTFLGVSHLYTTWNLDCYERWYHRLDWYFYRDYGPSDKGNLSAPSSKGLKGVLAKARRGLKDNSSTLSVNSTDNSSSSHGGIRSSIDSKVESSNHAQLGSRATTMEITLEAVALPNCYRAVAAKA
jgi:hypothetical protein